MEEIKQSIINHFDSKNENFKELLNREFTRHEPSITAPRIYVYRDILILELYRELLERNGNLLEGIEKNPLDFIEETLYSHLLN
ncbi:hypothetical protein [Flavobacterium psychrotolerans]|uniref:Uncharacterized protein n=1 Tax=Flavobacterium psychrotolerans TaxID=2169410 RepID=A0A2U1JGI9_9FLAO|nr:hypothetical protein [Flavobacterium psychrotolerans]PWA03983.1 hypothetical protein DB895_13415 [Flavobacterium psychrotolerans]